MAGQELIALILESLEQDDLDANQYIMEKMPDTLQDLVHGLLEPFDPRQERGGEPAPEKLVEDLIRSVMALRSARARKHLDQLVYMQKEIQEQGNLRIDDIQGITSFALHYSLALKAIDRALGQPVQFD